MRRTQRGVTFIGWLFLLIPIALILYCGIRLTPIYLNYMKVTKAMNETADDAKSGDATSAQALRDTLEKRFDVEYVDHPTVKDIDVHRDGDHWVMSADYEDVAPLFYNLSLLVQFQHQVSLAH